MEAERPSYKTYIEYNESLEYKRENIDINEKSEIVNISIPENGENRQLEDKLLVDIKFPKGYIFSIAGNGQIEDIEEFKGLFTLNLEVYDNNKKELSPDSRIVIHKEKDIDDHETRVVRLDSTFYKNVSKTEFNKELPNSVKTVDKLYKFHQGAEFKGGEHLRIYIIDSDIDISPENVKLNINLDKWDL